MIVHLRTSLDKDGSFNEKCDKLRALLVNSNDQYEEVIPIASVRSDAGFGKNAVIRALSGTNSSTRTCVGIPIDWSAASDCCLVASGPDCCIETGSTMASSEPDCCIFIIQARCISKTIYFYGNVTSCPSECCPVVLLNSPLRTCSGFPEISKDTRTVH